MIRFPIVRRLQVKNYELFETHNSDGITHFFARGVHAVVGINGLGKTTLLNMLYRGLLGPFDQSKSDDAGLLGSQHELSTWRTKGYFRDRVSDGARNATVEIDVAFGDNLITVRRRLANLEIAYLAVDGEPLDATQEAYSQTVLRLSGIASYFDFFAILRYLVFFLEDRVELIWDKRSQFDMLRILLFDTASAKAASGAYDEAQQADSQHRNRRVFVNRDRVRLAELEAAAGLTQSSTVRALQTAISEIDEKDRELAETLSATEQRIDQVKLRRARTLLDLQEARTALEFEEQSHFKQLFPNIGDTARHVLLNILSDGGCLVCGTTGSDVAQHLRDRLASPNCPVCQSHLDRHERIPANAGFSSSRLRTLNAKALKLRDAVASATDDIERATEEYNQLAESREESRQEWRRLRSELLRHGPLEIPDDQEIESLRAAVKEGEKQLSTLEANRSSAEARYGRIIRKQKAAIEKVTKTIRRKFREYASMVLAERCELNISQEQRAIGQEGRKFEFPYFEVLMTSGVFDQSYSSRKDADAVSESQKEFLDVAFRLALIDATTAGKIDSMLVLETPESSLDSLFVAKVGEAFRHYAEDKRRSNVLVASTNLNNEEMLSAMLGVRRAPVAEVQQEGRLHRDSPSIPPAPIVPPKQRPSRLINLLELAAPNAALRMHRQYYHQLLAKALK